MHGSLKLPKPLLRGCQCSCLALQRRLRTALPFLRCRQLLPQGRDLLLQRRSLLPSAVVGRLLLLLGRRRRLGLPLPQGLQLLPGLSQSLLQLLQCQWETSGRPVGAGDKRSRTAHDMSA